VQGTDETSQQDDQGSVWVSTWGHGGSHDSDGNAAAMSSNGSGVLIGADRDLGTWRVGAVAGSGQLSNSSTEGTAADAHSTDTVLGLYTGLDLGAWQLQGGAAHSWYTTRSHRQINVPGIAGSETARYDSGLTQAYVDGGYQFTFARSTLTPFVDLASVWIHQGAINEGGGVAALDVQGNSSSVNYGTAGVRGVFEPSPGLQFHASVGFQHAWGDLQSINQQQFAGGSDSFTVAGLPVAMNAGVVDLGMRFTISKNVTVDAGYHGQFANGATDQGAKMALNVSF
jgi:fibronectin-binding autotransporter adhesin